MYVDVMAADSDELTQALKEVEAHTSFLRVLGSYRSASAPV